MINRRWSIDIKVSNIVTRNLFRGVFRIRYIALLPFLSRPFIPFSPLPAANCSSNPAKGFGEHVSFRQRGGERTTFAATRRVPWALNTPFRAQGTRLVAANVVLFLLNELQQMKRMRLCLNVYCMLRCSRLLTSVWLFFYILFTFGTQNTPLVTAWKMSVHVTTPR